MFKKKKPHKHDFHTAPGTGIMLYDLLRQLRHEGYEDMKVGRAIISQASVEAKGTPIYDPTTIIVNLPGCELGEWVEDYMISVRVCLSCAKVIDNVTEARNYWIDRIEKARHDVEENERRNIAAAEIWREYNESK